MANSTQTATLKISPTLYPSLINQNVKVYSFNTTTNTYKCLGISQVDSSGSITIVVPENGTYFITPMDGPLFDTNNMTLVYSDTFEYTGLPDTNDWAYDVGNGTNGWGNNELEYYQDANSNNVAVNDGVLTLTALYDKTGITDGSTIYNYTSTRMYTKQSWLYGKVEVEAILPQACGTWPAIWMMPETSTFGAWPLSGEIDIMEMENNIQNVIHGSLQSADNYFKSKTYTNTATFPVETSNTAYHVYGCTWTPEYITLQVDGIDYFKFSRNLAESYNSEVFPWTIPYYLILNIAVGGTSGGTVTPTDFPQSMKINSIKIYDLALDQFDLNNNFNATYTFVPTYTNALETNYSESIIGTTVYVDTPSAEVTQAVSPDGYELEITNSGTADWHIQLYADTTTLAHNVNYYFTVDLNSSIARQIAIGVQNPTESTPYFTNTYNLVEGSNTITGTFSLIDAIESAHFILYLGNNNGNTIMGTHTVTVQQITVNDTQISQLSSVEEPFTLNALAKLGNKRSLFSWESANLLTNTSSTAELCNTFGITDLYQAIPLADLTASLSTTIEAFNKIATNTEICQVIGTPQWYNTSSGAMTQLEGIVAYNKIATADTKINTVVLDVEPWSLTDAWESDYLTVLNTLHSYTKSNNLTLLITLPYWMSTTPGASNTYAELMGAVDGVIMMNYNRNCYDTAVTAQVTTAQSNKQQIYIAAELQPVNSANGITTNTTYADVGLQTLYLNWLTLQNQYNYENLGFTYDDLSSLQALYTTTTTATN